MRLQLAGNIRELQNTMRAMLLARPGVAATLRLGRSRCPGAPTRRRRQDSADRLSRSKTSSGHALIEAAQDVTGSRRCGQLCRSARRDEHKIKTLASNFRGRRAAPLSSSRHGFAPASPLD